MSEYENYDFLQEDPFPGTIPEPEHLLVTERQNTQAQTAALISTTPPQVVPRPRLHRSSSRRIRPVQAPRVVFENGRIRRSVSTSNVNAAAMRQLATDPMVANAPLASVQPRIPPPNHDDSLRQANAIMRLHNASTSLHEAVNRIFTLLVDHFPPADENSANESAAIDALLGSFHALATAATPSAPPQQ
jgi:hypothetical protein